MIRSGPAWLAGLLLLLWAGGLWASEPRADQPPLPVVGGDDRALAELATELGVADEMPGPSLMGWIADATETTGHWLASLLIDRLGVVSELALELVRWSLALLLAVLLAFVAVYLWRWLSSRAAGEELVPVAREVTERLQEHPGSAAAWGEELARRLQAGDAAGAAEALWWWLARALGCDAEPSWTSRELIVRAGRRDLAPSVRRLDWLLYGPAGPGIAEVEALWHELASASGGEGVVQEGSA